MPLTLKQLSEEYENCIVVQKQVIESYNLKLKKARAQSNFREIKKIHTMLRILYDEKSELEEKAYLLKKHLS